MNLNAAKAFSVVYDADDEQWSMLRDILWHGIYGGVECVCNNYDLYVLYRIADIGSRLTETHKRWVPTVEANPVQKEWLIGVEAASGDWVYFRIGYHLCPKDGNIAEFLYHLAKKATNTAITITDQGDDIFSQLTVIEGDANLAKNKELQWILKKELGLW